MACESLPRSAGPGYELAKKLLFGWRSWLSSVRREVRIPTRLALRFRASTGQPAEARIHFWENCWLKPKGNSMKPC